MEDLYNLLTVLYQGSVRKNPLAVPPVYQNHAQFFKKEDLPTLAAEYDLPLPPDVDTTLKVGLQRGIYQRSIEDGTQCGASVCQPTTRLPTLIYAYNPNMLKVNKENQQILSYNPNSPTGMNCVNCYQFQTVSGSFVRHSNNRYPCPGQRVEKYF